jgi:hypothetical protein
MIERYSFVALTAKDLEAQVVAAVDDRAADIAIVIAQRLGNRFTDRFQTGEVNDGGNWPIAENTRQQSAIADIADVKSPPPSAPCRHASRYNRYRQ